MEARDGLPGTRDKLARDAITLGSVRFRGGKGRGERGFVGFFVGLDVGKMRLPDMSWLSVINSFRCKCRKCRVSIGVESL